MMLNDADDSLCEGLIKKTVTMCFILTSLKGGTHPIIQDNVFTTELYNQETHQEMR